MRCPVCFSKNVSVQFTNRVQLTTKHHGLIWWTGIGWWWVPIKWIVFTPFALIVWLFHPKRYKVKNKTRMHCMCNDCGHYWER